MGKVLSNVRKKIRESANVTKELLHMMLELHNVRMKPSNVMFWEPDIVGCLLVDKVPTKKMGGIIGLPQKYSAFISR